MKTAAKRRKARGSGHPPRSCMNEKIRRDLNRYVLPIIENFLWGSSVTLIAAMIGHTAAYSEFCQSDGMTCARCRPFINLSHFTQNFFTFRTRYLHIHPVFYNYSKGGPPIKNPGCHISFLPLFLPLLPPGGADKMGAAAPNKNLPIQRWDGIPRRCRAAVKPHQELSAMCTPFQYPLFFHTPLFLEQSRPRWESVGGFVLFCGHSARRMEGRNSLRRSALPSKGISG